MSRYQKGKTNLDFTEARDNEWQWHQLGICKSAPSSRQITTPAPHCSVFYRLDALPAAQPTASKHWRHTQLMPLHPKTPSSLASLKSRLVLPFWYRLTRVGPEKRPLNGCTSSAVIRGETDLEHEVAGRYTTIASVVSAAAHSSDCSHRTPGCMSSRRGTLAASSAERRPRRLGDALMDQSTNCYNSHTHATFCRY